MYRTNSPILPHALVPHSNLQEDTFGNLFTKTKKSGKNYDLLYQDSIRKYDLKH